MQLVVLNKYIHELHQQLKVTAVMCNAYKYGQQPKQLYNLVQQVFTYIK